MGVSASKRRARRAKREAKRQQKAEQEEPKTKKTTKTTIQPGAEADCTACCRELSRTTHALLGCAHRLCERCAATCVDDLGVDRDLTLVCPTCLKTANLEDSAFVRQVRRTAIEQQRAAAVPVQETRVESTGQKVGPGWEAVAKKKASAEDAGSGGKIDPKVPISDEFVCGKHGVYRLRRLLGKGGFGEVYTAENLRSGIVDAMKLEDTMAPRHQLKKEWKLYCELGANVNSPYTGIPRVYWFGRIDQYRCMLMEGLGMSLQAKFKADNKIWSVETISRIGIQMIDVLEYVHKRHIMHRDLKPGNIMLDKANQRLYLIDYGLSTYYADVSTGRHIPQLDKPRTPAKEGALVGTATFCSIRAHEHVRLSRRDDLEEMSYLIAYFVRGNLPWQVSKTIEKPRRNKMIYASKKGTSPEQLFRGHPRQFRQVCQYSRELAYDAVPDYDLLRSWLTSLLEERGANPTVLEPWSDAHKPLAGATSADKMAKRKK